MTFPMRKYIDNVPGYNEFLNNKSSHGFSFFNDWIENQGGTVLFDIDTDIYIIVFTTTEDEIIYRLRYG